MPCRIVMSRIMDLPEVGQSEAPGSLIMPLNVHCCCKHDTVCYSTASHAYSTPNCDSSSIVSLQVSL